jgi:NADH:ubiquinone oxidoreductase subunit 2 (subunit N)
MQIPIITGSLMQTTFAIIGVITLLVGSIGIATQWRIVRFISYSAITNLGFLLLTVTTTDETVYMYYIAIYALTNIN